MEEYLNNIFGGNGFNFNDEIIKDMIWENWSKLVLDRERKRKEEYEKNVVKFFNDCPFKLELVVFTKNEQEEWNIDDNYLDNFYYITNKEQQRLFGETMFYFNPKDIKAKVKFLSELWGKNENFDIKTSYMLAEIFIKDTYSESTAKHCNLKSRKKYSRVNSIIDAETCSVIYKQENSYISSYVKLYDNIMITEKKDIIFIPTMKTILEKDKYDEVFKTNENLIAIKKTYSSLEPDAVMVIDRMKGKITEID